MKQDLYIAFVNAKGRSIPVVVVWVGSVIGPLFVLIEYGNFQEWPFYVGVGLSLAVLFSVAHGLRSLKAGVLSDFLVYSAMPLLIPAIAFSMFLYSAKA